MRTNKGMKLAIAAALLSLSAMADHGGNNNNGNNNGNNNRNNNQGSFESGLVGSVPGLTIGGVASGGLPWTVQQGEASVSGGGGLEVHIRGLLISSGTLTGTVGPIQMVAASLVCGGSGGMVAASTGGVPLSASGDADIEANITVPSSCFAPGILVRIFNNAANPGSELGPFIAVSGLNMSMANGVQNNNNNDGEHRGGDR